MLFLPFEQRMTRDMQQRRDRRAARRLKGVGAPSLGSSAFEAWPGAGLGSDTSKASLLQDIPSGLSDAVVHSFMVHACLQYAPLTKPSRMTHGCRPLKQFGCMHNCGKFHLHDCLILGSAKASCPRLWHAGAAQ